MGIGIWYEMFVSDPVAFLFKNADPRGSLRANVSNATVRCLSNMQLDDMLDDRHPMSRTRARRGLAASPTSGATSWARSTSARCTSATAGMIRQIEEKVVNRLRQVTSAIQQDGANQVTSSPARPSARRRSSSPRAAAMRPQIVGEALQRIGRDPEVEAAMFEVLETEQLLKSPAPRVILLPGARGSHRWSRPWKSRSKSRSSSVVGAGFSLTVTPAPRPAMAGR